MKRRKSIILISVFVFVSFFVVCSVFAKQKDAFDLTLANIEALSTNESPFSPCNVAGGCCFMNNAMHAGIHIAKD